MKTDDELMHDDYGIQPNKIFTRRFIIYHLDLLQTTADQRQMCDMSERSCDSKENQEELVDAPTSSNSETNKQLLMNTSRRRMDNTADNVMEDRQTSRQPQATAYTGTSLL
jgi:hypothetical protein